LAGEGSFVEFSRKINTVSQTLSRVRERVTSLRPCPKVRFMVKKSESGEGFRCAKINPNYVKVRVFDPNITQGFEV
jgi:hypothetical protein